MTRTVPLIALTLALAACSNEPAEPQPTGTDSPVVQLPKQVATPLPEKSEPEPSLTPDSTPAPIATASEPVAASAIPKAIQGRWGLVPKDCTSKLGDAKGLLTVSASQLKFYESVAKLGPIAEADDSRIKAKFTYSGEGMTWVHDVVLDVQDGGKTLIRRNYGPDAGPGPLKYTRCT